MKVWVLLLHLFSFGGIGCELKNQYFFAHTKNHPGYIEVCVIDDLVYYTSNDRGYERTTVKKLEEIEMHRVIDGYEVIIKNTHTTLAVMDNDHYASLLTITPKRKIAFFTELLRDEHYVSHLYALYLLKNKNV